MSTIASHNTKLEALERLCVESPVATEAVWAFCCAIRQERMQHPTLSQASAAKLDYLYRTMVEE